VRIRHLLPNLNLNKQEDGECVIANLRSRVKEYPPQEHERTTMNLHKRWKMWIENLEYCFTFEGLDANENADTKKKAAMLTL